MSDHEQTWVCPTTDKAELFAEAVKRRGFSATQDGTTVYVDVSVQGHKIATLPSLATNYSGKRSRDPRPIPEPPSAWDGLFA